MGRGGDPIYKHGPSAQAPRRSLHCMATCTLPDVRYAEPYGDVLLSIQVDIDHRGSQCTHADILNCERVEMALLDSEEALVKPSALGLSARFDRLFARDGVARPAR